MADIAKITKEEEWVQVVDAYKVLLADPKSTKSAQVKEMRNKLESFINKHLVKLNNKAQKDLSKLQGLLNFLLLVDEKLPLEDFFGNASLDIFPTIFKLTFYGEDHSVINLDPAGSGYINAIQILFHEEILAKVSSTKRLEDKCNIVVNNLIAKMIIHCDKQKILI